MSEASKDVEVSKEKEAESASTEDEAVSRWPLLDLHSEIDRLFERAARAWPSFSGGISAWKPFGESTGLSDLGVDARRPSTDIAETDEAYEIGVELPGVEEKDIEVSVSGGNLTISGVRRSEREETEKNVHLIECRYGRFERRFRLPENVDAENIQASLEKGVLRIVLPKQAVAEEEVRKIDVQTAA